MRSSCFLIFLASILTLPACAQPAAPTQLESAPDPARQTTSEQPPPMQDVPDLSQQEIEAFLQSAEIVKMSKLETGTTGSVRATLSDGKTTHEAHVQCLDVYRRLWKGADGTVERNFRDSWKFNVAAWRLARLLGIERVPVSVERNVDGRQCSVTWWVDNVWIDEATRRAKGIKPPATDQWVNQLNTIRVFDQLIYNMDRNQQNLLITPEWNVWMIDHTRAFRVERKLMNGGNLKRIDAKLLQALRDLNMASLKKAVGPWLRQEEMSALLARRDEIVRYFETEVRDKGEEAVLTGLPKSTPHVSVP